MAFAIACGIHTQGCIQNFFKNFLDIVNTGIFQGFIKLSRSIITVGKEIHAADLSGLFKNSCAFRGFRFNAVSHFINTQRVISVDLKRIIKSLNGTVAYKWGIQHIASAVLVNIAEVAVTLGIIFRKHGEEVVISFHISVLSGIQVKDLVLSKFYRISASQQVIQIILAAVCIKDRICGLCCDPLCNLSGQRFCLSLFFLKPSIG